MLADEIAASMTSLWRDLIPHAPAGRLVRRGRPGCRSGVWDPMRRRCTPRWPRPPSASTWISRWRW
ncbi:MAG TPA: hypothetical protein VHZ33_01040 [Trebonia sp.]|nr:hypothetical protein [Trebonia sp.]